MSKPKHVGLLSMCDRVAPTNMGKIATLTVQARGDRTNAAFAEACGVNPATISRIINAKFRKNLSDDVIAAIAVNAVTSTGSFFKQLLDAHGLVIPAAEGKSPAEQDQLYTEYLNQVRASLDMSRKTKTDQTVAPGARKEAIQVRVRETIQNYLINQGFRVARDPNTEAMETMEFPWNASFVLDTNALEAEGLSKWAFVVTESAGWQLQQLFYQIAGYAYFDRPAAKGYRITVVTTDENTFYLARRDLAACEAAHDSISLMLVDTRYNMLMAEYILPRETETVQVTPKGKEDIDWAEIYGVPDDDA